MKPIPLPKFTIRGKRKKKKIPVPLSCPIPPRPKMRPKDRELLLRCVDALTWASAELRSLGKHDLNKLTAEILEAVS